MVQRPAGDKARLLERRERMRRHRYALEELWRVAALYLADDMSREALAEAVALVQATR